MEMPARVLRAQNFERFGLGDAARAVRIVFEEKIVYRYLGDRSQVHGELGDGWLGEPGVIRIRDFHRLAMAAGLKDNLRVLGQ